MRTRLDTPTAASSRSVVAAWLAGQASENTRSAYRIDLAPVARWCAQQRPCPPPPGPAPLLAFGLATQAPADARRALRQPLGRHNTDGLLIFTDNVQPDELGRWHRQGFPVVLLYRSAPAGLPIPACVIANRTGARQVVEHLIVAHARGR